MSDEEWGPWIEHDGKGCHVRGQVVRIEYINNYNVTYIKGPLVAGCAGGRSWDWSNAPEYTRILRYQVKKPKGLKMLEELIQNLPAPTKEMEKT